MHNNKPHLVIYLVAFVNVLVALGIVWFALMRRRTPIALSMGLSGLLIAGIVTYSTIHQYFLTRYFYYVELSDSFATLFGPDNTQPDVFHARSPYQKINIVLAVDAFRGDSIPMHLLTEEAMNLYWRHLADDGVLALHLTNIHLDLFDVVRNLAQHAGKQAFLIVDRGAKPWEMKSDWVIITSNRALIGRADIARAVSHWPTKQPEPIYWTDNFSNLYDVVLWN